METIRRLTAIPADETYNEALEFFVRKKFKNYKKLINFAKTYNQ